MLASLACSSRRLSKKKKRKQRLLTDKKTRENSMFSFYVTITTRTFSTQLVLLSFSRVSQMKVIKGNQRRGGVRGTEDKFTISRACVVQVSLSDTQVHIHLHKLYPKLTHYIMYYFTKWDIDCLGTHYIIKNLYVRLSYFTQ